MTKAEEFVLQYKDKVKSEEKLRAELHRIAGERPELSFKFRQVHRAYVDQDGNLVIPYTSSSGGPQPTRFDREGALELARWILDVFSEQGQEHHGCDDIGCY